MAAATAKARAKWNPSQHPRDSKGRFTRSATRVMQAADTSGAKTALAGARPANARKAGGSGPAGSGAQLLGTVGGGTSADEAMQAYLAGGWRDTNKRLRSEKNASTSPDIVALDDNFAPLEEDLLLERRVPLQMFSHIPIGELVGMKVRDAAPASTNLDGELGPAPDGVVTMHVITPAGTDVFVNSAEGEVILARDTEIAVTKAVPNGRNGWDLFGVVIPARATTRPSRGRRGQDDRDQTTGGVGGSAAGSGSLGDGDVQTDTSTAGGRTSRARAGTAGATAGRARDANPDGQPDNGEPADTDAGTARPSVRPADGGDDQPEKARRRPAKPASTDGDGEADLDAEARRPAGEDDDVVAAAARADNDKEQAQAASRQRRSGGGEQAPKAPESKLAALSPTDQVRVAVAVEDQGPGIFQSPMTRGSFADVGRYVSEGGLDRRVARDTTTGTLWDAVEEFARANPELLARTPAQVKARQQERADEMTRLGKEAGHAAKNQNYEQARALVNQGEAIDPDFRFRGTRSWDEMRVLIANFETMQGSKPKPAQQDETDAGGSVPTATPAAADVDLARIERDDQIRALGQWGTVTAIIDGGKQFQVRFPRDKHVVVAGADVREHKPRVVEEGLFGESRTFAGGSRSGIGISDRADVGRERAIASAQQLGMFDDSEKRQLDGQAALLDQLLQVPAADTPTDVPTDVPDRLSFEALRPYRGHWEYHANANRVVWFGHGAKPKMTGELATIERRGGRSTVLMVRGESEDSDLLLRLNVNDRFWAAPLDRLKGDDEKSAAGTGTPESPAGTDTDGGRQLWEPDADGVFAADGTLADRGAQDGGIPDGRQLDAMMWALNVGEGVLPGNKKLVRRQLAKAGWADENGRLTPDGYAAARRAAPRRYYDATVGNPDGGRISPQAPAETPVTTAAVTAAVSAAAVEPDLDDPATWQVRQGRDRKWYVRQGPGVSSGPWKTKKDAEQTIRNVTRMRAAAADREARVEVLYERLVPEQLEPGDMYRIGKMHNAYDLGWSAHTVTRVKALGNGAVMVYDDSRDRDPSATGHLLLTDSTPVWRYKTKPVLWSVDDDGRATGFTDHRDDPSTGGPNLSAEFGAPYTRTGDDGLPVTTYPAQSIPVLVQSEQFDGVAFNIVQMPTVEIDDDGNPVFGLADQYVAVRVGADLIPLTSRVGRSGRPLGGRVMLRNSSYDGLASGKTAKAALNGARLRIGRDNAYATYSKRALDVRHTRSTDDFNALPQTTDIQVGDIVAVKSFNRLRDGIAVKVTDTRVEVLVGTPSSDNPTFAGGVKGVDVRLVRKVDADPLDTPIGRGRPVNATADTIKQGGAVIFEDGRTLDVLNVHAWTQKSNGLDQLSLRLHPTGVDHNRDDYTATFGPGLPVRYIAPEDRTDRQADAGPVVTAAGEARQVTAADGVFAEGGAVVDGDQVAGTVMGVRTLNGGALQLMLLQDGETEVRTVQPGQQVGYVRPEDRTDTTVDTPAGPGRVVPARTDTIRQGGVVMYGAVPHEVMSVRERADGPVPALEIVLRDGNGSQVTIEPRVGALETYVAPDQRTDGGITNVAPAKEPDLWPAWTPPAPAPVAPSAPAAGRAVSPSPLDRFSPLDQARLRVLVQDNAGRINAVPSMSGDGNVARALADFQQVREQFLEGPNAVPVGELTRAIRQVMTENPEWRLRSVQEVAAARQERQVRLQALADRAGELTRAGDREGALAALDEGERIDPDWRLPDGADGTSWEMMRETARDDTPAPGESDEAGPDAFDDVAEDTGLTVTGEDEAWRDLPAGPQRSAAYAAAQLVQARQDLPAHQIWEYGLPVTVDDGQRPAWEGTIGHYSRNGFYRVDQSVGDGQAYIPAEQITPTPPAAGRSVFTGPNGSGPMTPEGRQGYRSVVQDAPLDAVFASRRPSDADLDAAFGPAPDGPAPSPVADLFGSPEPSEGPQELDLFGGGRDFVGGDRAALGIADRPMVGRTRGMAAVQQLGMFDVSDQQQLDGQTALLDALMQVPPSPLPDHVVAVTEPDAPETDGMTLPDDLTVLSDEQLAALYWEVPDEGFELISARIMLEWDRRETAMRDAVARIPDDLSTLDSQQTMQLIADLTSLPGTLPEDHVTPLQARLDQLLEEAKATEAWTAEQAKWRAILDQDFDAFTSEDQFWEATAAANQLDDQDMADRIDAAWTAFEARVEAEARREEQERMDQAAAEQAAAAAEIEARAAEETAEAARREVQVQVDAVAAAAAGGYVTATYDDANSASHLLPDDEVARILDGGSLRSATPAQRVALLWAAARLEGNNEFDGMSERDLMQIQTRAMFGPRDGTADVGRSSRAAAEMSRRRLESNFNLKQDMTATFAAKLLAGDLASMSDDQLSAAPAMLAALRGADLEKVPARLGEIRAEAERRIAAAETRAAAKAAGPSGPARIVDPIGALNELERNTTGYQRSAHGQQGGFAARRLNEAKRRVLGLPDDASEFAIKDAWKADPRPLPELAGWTVAWFRHVSEHSDDLQGPGRVDDWMRGPADDPDLPDVPTPLPPAKVSNADKVWEALRQQAQADIDAGDFRMAVRYTMAMNRAYGIRIANPDTADEDTVQRVRRTSWNARTSDNRNPAQRAAAYIAEYQRLALEDGVDLGDTARYGPFPKDKVQRVRMAGNRWRQVTPATEARLTALIGSGMDVMEAYAEVYDLDIAVMRREEADAMVRGANGRNISTEAAYKELYYQMAEEAYMAAEENQTTNGYLLNKAGKAAGIDPASLFTGSHAHAYKYASEELKIWWAGNPPPRMTFTEFKETLRGDPKVYQGLLQKSKGNEFA